MSDQIHNMNAAFKIASIQQDTDRLIEQQKQTILALQKVEAKHKELIAANTTLKEENALMKAQLTQAVQIAENTKALEAVKEMIKEEVSSSNLDKTIKGIIEEMVRVIDRNVGMATSICEMTDGRYQPVPDEIKKTMHDETSFMKERFLIYFMELGRMDVLNFYKHFPQYDPNKQ